MIPNSIVCLYTVHHINILSRVPTAMNCTIYLMSFTVCHNVCLQLLEPTHQQLGMSLGHMDALQKDIKCIVKGYWAYANISIMKVLIVLVVLTFNRYHSVQKCISYRIPSNRFTCSVVFVYWPHWVAKQQPWHTYHDTLNWSN